MSATRDVNELEAQALSLPIDARAALTRRLLKSLEEVSEAEYERLWGAESVRRAAHADAERTRTASGAEVARKARSLAPMNYSFFLEAESDGKPAGWHRAYGRAAMEGKGRAGYAEIFPVLTPNISRDSMLGI